MSVTPGALQFLRTRLCDVLLYLHKTKCLANVGRGHLVSVFHKHNAGLFIRDVATKQYVCTAGCDSCSLYQQQLHCCRNTPGMLITTKLQRTQASCGEIYRNLHASSPIRPNVVAVTSHPESCDLMLLSFSEVFVSSLSEVLRAADL